MAQMVKNLHANAGEAGSIPGEDPLEKEMATHSSILALKFPWTEEPGELQSMGSQRVRHDWMTEHSRIHTGLPRWFSGKESTCQCRKMQETRVWYLGWEDPPKSQPIPVSILAWRIPWTEKPGGLQSMGLQRVGHNCPTEYTCVYIYIYIFNFSIIYYYEILNSLCYTVSPCLLTILYIVVYVC